MMVWIGLTTPQPIADKSIYVLRYKLVKLTSQVERGSFESRLYSLPYLAQNSVESTLFCLEKENFFFTTIF